ncbi:MAG: hypothetical protein M1817_001751 [Caeruleum heppii]|nr:MAG: hypothetical protein M1817_001751 [Caeruleum heppii]
MAPTRKAPARPTARPSKSAASLNRPTTARVPSAPSDETPFGVGPSKKDKRFIKHSRLVSRIEKANTTTKKRRRPSKKLVASLESLANALPDQESTAIGDHVVVAQARIKQKSLKSRPGAMKRKEKMERSERERFGKNMAQMAGNNNSSSIPIGDQQHPDPGSSVDSNSTSDRWAALRGFISQTLEQRPEPQATTIS